MRRFRSEALPALLRIRGRREIAADLLATFGIIKSAMSFRQFLLRGFENAKGEWNLVTMSWNIRRMFALSGA